LKRASLRDGTETRSKPKPDRSQNQIEAKTRSKPKPDRSQNKLEAKKNAKQKDTKLEVREQDLFPVFCLRTGIDIVKEDLCELVMAHRCRIGSRSIGVCSGVGGCHDEPRSLASGCLWSCTVCAGMGSLVCGGCPGLVFLAYGQGRWIWFVVCVWLM